MSFPQSSQCIHCDVSSCKHHSQKEGKCELDSIRVAPRDGCKSGNCDESLCASYHGK